MSKHLAQHSMFPPEKKPRLQPSRVEEDNEDSLSITKEEQDIIDSRLYVLYCSIIEN